MLSAGTVCRAGSSYSSSRGEKQNSFFFFPLFFFFSICESLDLLKSGVSYSLQERKIAALRRLERTCKSLEEGRQKWQ